MALQRAFRLRKSSEFLRVRQQGRSFPSRLLMLAFVTNESDAVRIGIVVSKRVSKHAVDRNRLKRQLSEVIRPLLPGLPRGTDIVLTVRNPALNADVHILREQVIMLLHRARLLETGQAAEASD